VDITCDNKLWFYADGHVIVNASTPWSSQWDVTKHVTIPADTKVYGIKCVDYHVVAGILAAFSDGTTTDNSWRLVYHCNSWIASPKLSILCARARACVCKCAYTPVFIYPSPCVPVTMCIRVHFNLTYFLRSVSRCTNKKPQGDWLSADFNDSTWQPAYVIHKNNKPSTYWNMRSDISRQASWIWTKGWQGKDKTVYCRKMHSGKLSIHQSGWVQIAERLHWLSHFIIYCLTFLVVSVMLLQQAQLPMTDQRITGVKSCLIQSGLLCARSGCKTSIV
jgi:hypothetical protein